MLRLYFNKRGPRPWSIDSGPGTKEVSFKTVAFSGCGTTVFDAKPGDKVQTATAWIEFPDGVLRASSGHAIIE